MKVYIVALVSSLIVFSPRSTTGQIISNFKHENFRDKVLLTYDLNGLAVHQRMEVAIYCSDDGYKTALRNVTGNGVGDGVAANGQKTIVWDVLHERKQLVGKTSFEIKAVVMDDEKTPALAINAGQASLSVEEKKSLLYAEVSAALGNFIIEGKNLVISFRKVNDQIFEDNVILRQITNSIINYNTAFNKLNTERMSYEKQVLMLWENEALYSDVRYLFDYALGDLHAVNVLELNNSLAMINDINQGKIEGRKNEKAAKDKVLADIFQNTGQLDKRIQELERRANRILYTLSNR